MKEAVEMVATIPMYVGDKISDFKKWFLRKVKKYRTVWIIRADGEIKEYLVDIQTGKPKVEIGGRIRNLKPDGWFYFKGIGPVAIYPEYSPDPITRDNIKLEGSITPELFNMLIMEAFQLGMTRGDEKWKKELKKYQVLLIVLVGVTLYLTYQYNQQIISILKQVASALQKNTEMLRALTGK